MPYSYAWSSTPVQNNDFATGLVAGTYSLVVTDVNQCHKDTTVVITSPPQLLTTAGNNDTICPNTPLTLSASASGGVGTYTYLWQPGGIVGSDSLAISPASSITYTVAAIDQNNCVGVPDTVRAFVYSLTPLNVQMSSTSPICPGRSSVISATVTGLTGALTYQWNPAIGGDSAGPFTVVPAQPSTYSVTITNICDSVLLDSARVLFNPPPTINITPNANALCFHETFQFNDNSVSGNSSDPINSWLWNFGDNSSTSLLQNPTHTYQAFGTYNVRLTVTTGGGCTNNNSLSPFVINAYQYPVSLFSINSTSFEIPFDNLIGNNRSRGASSYLWDFGDGTVSTLKDPTHLYSLVGNFKVQLIAISNKGCMDTSFTFVTTTTKITFPNAFTPNKKHASGGIYNIKNLENDVFFPYTSGIVEYDFEVYNRWGELIFITKDVDIGWDGYYRGALCEQGVYVWKAIGKFNDGQTFKLTGDVTLLW